MKISNKLKVLGVIGYLLYVFLYFYIVLPPLNWHDPAFYAFLMFTLGPILVGLIIYCGGHLGYSFVKNKLQKSEVIDVTTDGKRNKFLLKASAILLVLIIVIPVLSGFIGAKFFHASEYASRIEVKNVDFSAIPEVDFKTTPIIDRQSSETLGDKVMGNMSEWVSQFEVSNEYTQISYQNSVARVTPLTYNGLIKYFKNRGNGIPAYIKVDSTNGETELVKLSDLNLGGMKYVPSAMFHENLMRHLRFNYPTTIFGSPSFEIDEQGHPWYICSTYTYKGVGVKKQVTGAIFLDPISGNSTKYALEDIPAWADRVYPESLVIEELDDYGALQDGFINSIFGQSGVIATSEGYNYLEKDGDIWLYSGITSVNADAANLGFVLVNLRTHEAMRIACPGANETSAMTSAQAEVKNYGYTSTFPLLTNVKGNPVYLMSLKDQGIIKMYAMVSASDYQKVAVVNSDEGLEALSKKMLNVLGSSHDEVSSDTLKETTIKVVEKEVVNSEGTTIYYIKGDDGNIYKIPFSVKYEDDLIFMKKDAELNISYIDTDGVKTIKEIK